MARHNKGIEWAPNWQWITTKLLKGRSGSTRACRCAHSVRHELILEKKSDTWPWSKMAREMEGTSVGLAPKQFISPAAAPGQGVEKKNGGEPLKEMIYVVCKVWWTETKLVRRPLHVHYNFGWTGSNWYLLKLFLGGGGFRHTISSKSGQFRCLFALQFLLFLPRPFKQYSTKCRPLCIV